MLGLVALMSLGTPTSLTREAELKSASGSSFCPTQHRKGRWWCLQHAGRGRPQGSSRLLTSLVPPRLSANIRRVSPCLENLCLNVSDLVSVCLLYRIIIKKKSLNFLGEIKTKQGSKQPHHQADAHDWATPPAGELGVVQCVTERLRACEKQVEGYRKHSPWTVPASVHQPTVTYSCDQMGTGTPPPEWLT